MATLRQLADPHLNTLRTAGRALDRADADKWEQARYNLFKALDTDDEPGAKDWLNALETHLIIFANALKKVDRQLQYALTEIDKLIR